MVEEHDWFKLIDIYDTLTDTTRRARVDGSQTFRKKYTVYSTHSRPKHELFGHRRPSILRFLLKSISRVGSSKKRAVPKKVIITRGFLSQNDSRFHAKSRRFLLKITVVFKTIVGFVFKITVVFKNYRGFIAKDSVVSV